MRAIILAAGEGTRLRPYTSHQPKCLVKLGGRSLLDLQIEALGAVGIEDITIVTGYQSEKIEALDLATRLNRDYARTNMVASLMCADDLLDGGDDVLIAYGDIVYEPRIVEAVLSSRAPLATVVDTAWLDLWSLRTDDPLSDAETLKLDGTGHIRELGRRPTSYAEIEGQYIGLTKVAATYAPEMVTSYRRLKRQVPSGSPEPERMHMTDFLQLLIDNGCPVTAVCVEGGWLEVDTASDLELFNHLHDEEELSPFFRVLTSSRASPDAPECRAKPDLRGKTTHVA